MTRGIETDHEIETDIVTTATETTGVGNRIEMIGEMTAAALVPENAENVTDNHPLQLKHLSSPTVLKHPHLKTRS
jgi:hypothetical protein